MNNYCAFIVDARNAVIRPIQAHALLEDGRYVIRKDMTSAAYSIYDMNGNSIDVAPAGDAGYDCDVTGIGFDPDVTAFIVRDAEINFAAPQRYSIGFSDGCEATEVNDFIDLGGYSALQGPDQAIICDRNTALLFNRTNFYSVSPILVDRREGTAKLLLWDGETMSAVPVSERIGEDGCVVAMDDGHFPLLPIGVSYDGRYAAFVELDETSLLITDLYTLESSCVLSSYTPVEAGYNSLLVTLNSWQGGAYINGIIDYDVKLIVE